MNHDASTRKITKDSGARKAQVGIQKGRYPPVKEERAQQDGRLQCIGQFLSETGVVRSLSVSAYRYNIISVLTEYSTEHCSNYMYRSTYVTGLAEMYASFPRTRVRGSYVHTMMDHGSQGLKTCSTELVRDPWILRRSNGI